MSNSVKFQIQGPTAIATINRPEKKNAINCEAYGALIAAIAQVEASTELRSLVITGAENNFTTGNDLADFAKDPRGARIAIDFLKTISGAQKPILAAIEGFAVGIGTTMLLHCDFAFAGQNARFRLPFVNLGLTPEGGSSLLLPRLAGQKRAAELLMLGEEFSAAVALDAGLLTRTVEPGTALQTALEASEKLALLPAEALRLSKTLLRAEIASDLATVIDEEAKLFAQRLTSSEAMTAFAKFFARAR